MPLHSIPTMVGSTCDSHCNLGFSSQHLDTHTHTQVLSDGLTRLQGALSSTVDLVPYTVLRSV